MEQLSYRLRDRLELLSRGSRSVLARHETLRALIDWSYHLLTEQERSVLCWLSVFTGGWTLAAAEKVASGRETKESDVLAVLTELVNKSLVIYDQDRYRFLEPVRQFAQEKLEESGEEDDVRDKHLEYFVIWL